MKEIETCYFNYISQKSAVYARLVYASLYMS